MDKLEFTKRRLRGFDEMTTPLRRDRSRARRRSRRPFPIAGIVVAFLAAAGAVSAGQISNRLEGQGWLRSVSSFFDPACNIKGNISWTGENIFHVPGQEHYDETRIVMLSGERWFCSEAEARAAGWRNARR